MSAFTLNQADLAFILYQIKVSEAHAAGIPLTELRVDANGNLISDRLQYHAVTGVYLGDPTTPKAIPDSKVPVGLRTVDGQDNNLVPGREEWGAADQSMPRLLTPSYTTGSGTIPGVGSDGSYEDPGTIVDAAPRTVSNLIVDMSLNNPAAIIAALTFAGSEDVLGDQGEISAAFLALKAARDTGIGDIPALEAALDDILEQKGVTVSNGSMIPSSTTYLSPFPWGTAPKLRPRRSIGR
jgi:hypothetical protein